jgi:hypothetical protein
MKHTTLHMQRISRDGRRSDADRSACTAADSLLASTGGTLSVTHIETRAVDSAREAGKLASEWVAQGFLVRTDEVESDDPDCYDWTVTRWELVGATLRPYA